MPQKSLEKNTNKYLQQPFPENLTPNKDLGKREKYRPKIGLNPKISRMERNIGGGWLFFWNNLKKQRNLKPKEPKEKEYVDKRAKGGTEGIDDKLDERGSVASVASIASVTSVASVASEPKEARILLKALIGPKKKISFPRKKLIAPNWHMQNFRLKGVIGGNIVQYIVEAAQQVVVLEGKKQATPFLICTAEKAITAEKNMGEFVKQQIQKKNWSNIYSLQERWRIAQRSFNKINDDYKNQLQECRKIAILYGNLPKKILNQMMKRATVKQGNVAGHFLNFLERRLDVVLKRAFFFSSILTARQWICSGKILVNNQRQTFSGYLLQPADLISINPSAKLSWKRHWLQTFNILPQQARWNPKRGGWFKENRPWSTGVNKITGLAVPTGSLANEPEEAKQTVGSKQVSEPKETIKSSAENAFFTWRRFPFSPPIMKKWHLWGALRSERSNSSHTNVHHKWHSATRGAAPKGGSALFHYFYATGARKMTRTHALSQRGETWVTEWLKKRNAGQQKVFSHPSLKRGDGNLRALQLHHQQCSVVDGLYMCRWNRVFAQTRGDEQRKKYWRFHHSKPLHLECSYKIGVIVFLYAPQKLVWPSTINVALLQKGLTMH